MYKSTNKLFKPFWLHKTLDRLINKNVVNFNAMGKYELELILKRIFFKSKNSVGLNKFLVSYSYFRFC